MKRATPITLRDIGRSRLALWTAGFVVLACLAILALSGWREWETRRDVLRHAEDELSNLARSLVQHADDTFAMTDTVLLGLVDRLEADGTGAASMEKIQRFLHTRKHTGNRIRGIFVYDEAGRWLATTENVNLAAFNNYDRDYFQYHRNTDDRDTVVGGPVKSRSGGQWIVTASRRFNHPDGRFAGVALVTIDAAYFTKFYDQFDLGENGALSLISKDGIVLARSGDDGSLVGRDISGSPLIKHLRERPEASAYSFKSTLDGLQRISFYRLSSRYPVLLLASQAEDEVLAPWREQAFLRLAVVGGLTLVIAGVGAFLVRQLRQRQRMAAALVAKEADFRLLAEQSSDMVTRIDLDGRIRYISPSCVRVVGWEAAKLLGTPALAGLAADDRGRVEKILVSLRAGEAEEARIIYRTRHREKESIWVESALRVTRAANTGEIDGVVAITRDVTRQQELQDRLASLAASDGLTGLANRRLFDERLADEWARARRDGTALSLLLIDVDHFKKFNDVYGHQAGDACLRALGRVLAGQVRRPADLAARYGGEEFALLLPNTEVDGCREVGERVCEAVRDMAMLHAENMPSKVVTVSIGAATYAPAQSTQDAVTLVAEADRALYAAKATGRDRMLASGQLLKLPTVKSA